MSFAPRRRLERPAVPPLRSVLFAPGSNEAAVSRAMASGADAVVLDLEEPETPMTEAVRERAHSVCGEVLRERAGRAGSEGPLIFARVRTAYSGGAFTDLRALVGPALAGVLVPKIEGPEDVVAMDALLLAAEVEAERPRGSIGLYPILETAEGLRLAYEIAKASPRVVYMGGAISRFGDIHQALGYRWTAEGRETLFVRSKVLMDVKAAGIRYPVSGMWGGASDDLDGLRMFADELRALGYYGMMLGDPAHVPLVHEVFTPSAEEVAYWSDLVRLGDAAAESGEGPILYGDPSQGEGHEVHLAHVESARLNLEWARALGLA
ncbi:MAG: aldolase/citrate lyase family protein [bacterium]|nr:aldolase/citrate lyase family protein [bacterium]